MDHLAVESYNENHTHSYRCGKIVAARSGVAEQVRSIGVEVAERFEQAQTEWKQKIAHTEAQRSEHIAQKLGHTEAQKLGHTEAQKLEHTGARIGAQKLERIAAGGSAVVVAVAAYSNC